MSPRRATCRMVPCEQNLPCHACWVGSGAIPWAGCAAGGIERGAVQIPVMLPGTRPQLSSCAARLGCNSNSFYLFCLKEHKERQLCSGLFNFVWHFFAKGRCSKSPRQCSSNVKLRAGAAVQLDTPAQLRFQFPPWLF